MSESTRNSSTFIITHFRLIIEVGCMPAQDFLIIAHAMCKASPWYLTGSWWGVSDGNFASLLSAQVRGMVNSFQSAQAPDPWLSFVFPGFVL